MADTRTTTVSVRLTDEESEMLDNLVDHVHKGFAEGGHPELAEHFTRSSALRQALRMWHGHVTTNGGWG